MAISPPVGLRLTSDQPTHRAPEFLDIEWNPVVGAAGYEVDVIDGGGTRTIATLGMSLRVDGLVSNRGYRITVRARDAGGISADSLPIDVCTALPRPTSLRAYTLGGTFAGTFVLSWDESAIQLDQTFPVSIDVLREASDGTRSILLAGQSLVGSQTLAGVGGSIRLLQVLRSLHPNAPGGSNTSPESAAFDTSIAASPLTEGLGPELFRHRALLQRIPPSLPEN